MGYFTMFIAEFFVFWWKKPAFAAKELITLVYKTSLGMTRLLSTQHHTLGPVVFWRRSLNGEIQQNAKETFSKMTGKDAIKDVFSLLYGAIKHIWYMLTQEAAKVLGCVWRSPMGVSSKKGDPKTHVVNSQLATSIPKHGVMTWKDGPGYPYFSCSLHNQ